MSLAMISERIDFLTLTSGMLRLKVKVKCRLLGIDENSRQAKTKGTVSTVSQERCEVRT